MKTTGYIGEDGKYRRGEEIQVVPGSDIHKSWDHDRQRREHARDIIQPYLSDGAMNPEFAVEYPEEARTYARSSVIS